MRQRSRRLIALGGLLACLAAGPVAAQDRPANTMELLREKARVDKKLVVAAVLDLTEGEAKAFWPVYNAYQSDMVGHYDKLLGLIDVYAKAYSAMTDEIATKLLTDYLALERAHVALLSEYVPRFQKVLPPRKVAQFYQVENKLRALVNYDLASQIPIVK
jgi:hypothetical protein